MKLHGSIVSPYVARVVMCARAKGIDLQPERALGGGLDNLDAEPLVAIPLLEVSGQSFTGAMVICEYLEDAFPKRTIRPQDPLEREHSQLVAHLVDTGVLGRLGPLYRNLDPSTGNAVESEASLDVLRTGLTDLDRCMGRGPYAVASSLTLADCALLPAMALLNLVFFHAFRRKSPVETLPKLREWWAQMGEDPLCVLMLQDWTTAYQELMRARRDHTTPPNVNPDP